PRERSIIEVSSHGREQRVVSRDEVINDGLGQLICVVKHADKLRHLFRQRKNSNGDEDRGWPQLTHHTCTIIAERTNVELLRPSFSVIHSSQRSKYSTLE